MRKIVLSGKNNEDTVVLQIREATCNFCGEKTKKCVKGSILVGDANADVCVDCVRQIAVLMKLK